MDPFHEAKKLKAMHGGFHFWPKQKGIYLLLLFVVVCVVCVLVCLQTRKEVKQMQDVLSHRLFQAFRKDEPCLVTCKNNTNNLNPNPNQEENDEEHRPSYPVLLYDSSGGSG